MTSTKMGVIFTNSFPSGESCMPRVPNAMKSINSRLAYLLKQCAARHLANHLVATAIVQQLIELQHHW